MNIENKNVDMAGRGALCRRLNDNLRNDYAVLNDLLPREGNLKTNLQNTKLDLLKLRGELERARLLAASANLVGVFPFMRGPAFLLSQGLGTVTGIAAAREVDSLLREVENTENQVRRLIRDFHEVSRKLEERQRLIASTEKALADNRCEEFRS